MNDIYLYFGAKQAQNIEQELLKRDIRQSASERGEGMAEIFDISTAQPEQLKQFSYLVHPQGASFLENDQTLEQHLDMLENSADPEKVLAVLALSGQEDIPLQFLQAIHHLYQYHEEDSVAQVGETHYQPNIEAYSLFGLGAIEKEDLKNNFDIPSIFNDVSDWKSEAEKQANQENGDFSAEFAEDFEN